jgi:hypothetical protein
MELQKQKQNQLFLGDGMKITAFILGLLLSTSVAAADMILMVPQKPGAGTSIWAEIVAEELRKTPALKGSSVTLSFNPGARDIAGFNKFHTQMRNRHSVVMVSHGGNGVSYVQENVKYDYTQYDSICHQNLNIIVAKRTGWDEDNGFSFAAGSGMVPEGIAIALMIGGPGLTTQEYIDIFNEKVTWVAGMSGGQRRLAFNKSELLGTRENPAAYKSKVEPEIAKGAAETWFHHGVLDIATGEHVDDPNHLGKRFEDVFKAKWGVFPSGELYDAYTLIHTWRDSIQKALWVHKGNPNTELFRTACEQMANNPESIAIFQKKIGQYDWIIGEDGNKTVEILHGLITESALTALVEFNKEALGLRSVFKQELITK